MVKNLPANAGNTGDAGSILGLGRSSGIGNGYAPVFFPGKFHGQRSLVGYSSWGHKELDMTEHCSFHFINNIPQLQNLFGYF